MTFEKACKELIVRDPFWGLFLMGVNRRAEPDVETAGVAPMGTSVQLLYNPAFWDSLNNEQQIAVLLHELEHLAFSHLALRDEFDDKEMFNIAADIEVNCYVRNLPDGVYRASDFSFPERKGTRWYYKELEKLPRNKRPWESNGSGGEGGGGGSDMDGQSSKDRSKRGSHKYWKEFDKMSSAQKKLIADSVESAVKRAAEQTMKGQGHLPGELKEIIDKLLEERERVYDWKAHLRRAMTSKIDLSYRTSYRKQSVRFPGSPGIRLRKKANVLVAVDCSGSISNDELVEFFGEIEHIRRSGADVHVMEFDAKVQNEWDYTGPRNIRISGRGGTDFSVVTDYWMEKRKDYSTLVMFTDGEAQPEDLAPVKKDLIWLVSSQGRHDHDYPGKVIYIPKQ